MRDLFKLLQDVNGDDGIQQLKDLLFSVLACKASNSESYLMNVETDFVEWFYWEIRNAENEEKKAVEDVEKLGNFLAVSLSTLNQKEQSKNGHKIAL